jgi:single-stranded-DNA-specific exonuclease
LANLFKKGATLVISADCGTTCYEEVKIAQKRGQDIIITDHHTCPDLLPPAVAVINPKRQDSIYPFPQLAGVGVAYKLIQALLWGQGREEVVNHFFDLIALGTVTDIAPLQGENRYLVKEGLKLLNKPRRPGVAEMIRAAGLEPGNIDPKSISWILGPRLNAAGRLEHAYLSFHLLLTDSPEEGRRLALELEKKNAERQKLLEAALEKAREVALTQGEAKLLMITRDDFPLGIIGLVASRLVDEFHRPAVVVRKGGTISRGSARSIPQFDIVAALKEYSHLFTHFGGHPLAAGFIIPTPHLSQLHQGLVGKAEEKLAGLELRPQIVIDAQIPLSNLDSKLFHFCQQLAPFGQGNPPPTFLSQGVKVVEAKAVGDGEHLRLKVKAGDITWQGIGFGLGGYAENLPPYVDLVYNLALDCWGGEEVLGLNILDLRPSR